MQGSDVKGHVLVVDDLGEICELLRARLLLEDTPVGFALGEMTL